MFETFFKEFDTSLEFVALNVLQLDLTEKMVKSTNHLFVHLSNPGYFYPVLKEYTTIEYSQSF